MKNIIIGQYVPRDSIIHHLDPRAKISAIFLLVFIVFLANQISMYGILITFLLLIIFLSKIPFSYILKGIKPVLWIILFTLFLHLFMTKEGDLVFKWGWIEFYEEGIRQGIFISLRFFLLIVSASLLTLTTTPIEITDGLENIFTPFKRFGVPAHELALMMSISLRFIPTLVQETEKIIKAQTARGIDFKNGKITERLKAIVALLVPLFISSFRRAEDLALAMEARGYRGGEGRTKLRELKWSKKDSVVVIVILLLGLLLGLIRFNG